MEKQFFFDETGGWADAHYEDIVYTAACIVGHYKKDQEMYNKSSEVWLKLEVVGADVLGDMVGVRVNGTVTDSEGLEKKFAILSGTKCPHCGIEGQYDAELTTSWGSQTPAEA